VHGIDRVRRPVDRAALAVATARHRLGTSPVVRRAVRHRLGAWAAALAVAVTVQHTVAGAAADRRAWGVPVDVVVATRSVGAGDRTGTTVLRLEPRPSRTVPAGALRSLPVGARAVVDLSPGQVVTGAMVDRHGRGPVASRLPPGRVAVTVGTGPVRPVVSRGDRVDVLADVVLARRATVLTARADRVTLAVLPAEAAATATSALSGPVALVVLR
jgi:Flp pilus assembly protein CpaB